MDLTGDFFSALRRMKTRGSVPPPVPDPLSLSRPEPAVPPPDRAQIEPDAPPRAVGPEGVALIKRFESCARMRRDGRYEAYPDPGTGGAPWTIGWGATGPDISAVTIWGQADCDARLERDLARCSRGYPRAQSRAVQRTSVRCTGQLSLQHRRDCHGHADPAARGRTLRRGRVPIRALGACRGQASARPGPPPRSRSGAV